MPPKKGYSCGLCHEKDDNDMVQCDVCDEWYHFKCVGVTSEVADVNWNCHNCYQKASVSTAMSTTAETMATYSNLSTTFATCSTTPTMANDRNPTLPVSTAATNSSYEYMDSRSRVQQARIPSAAQLAARQAIPKELPTFSGDPEEWPLFISSFENSTATAGFTDAENLMRLQACLKGRAREVVRYKLMIPAMVPEIISTLRMFFGQPESILEAVVEKARRMPPPKDRLDALVEYALSVRNIYATMEVCQMHAHLNNPMLVKELVDKLPNQQKLNWAMYPKDERVPAIKLFSDWLFNIAEAISKVAPICFKKAASVNTHDRVISQQPPIRPCLKCNAEDHKLSNCELFAELPTEQRWQFINENKLCRQCLNKHNRRCYVNKLCGIDGCSQKHHQLLHTIERQAEIVNAHSAMLNQQKPFFRIVPIKIISKNSQLDTFAFLDEGSSVTLIETHTFKKLNIEATTEPLCLRWTDESLRTDAKSMKADITIGNVDNGARFILHDVHTVDQLSLPTQSLNMDDISKKYKHLKGLPIKSYVNATPTILIGTNNWKVAVPLKVREGTWHQPIASKTRLGWALQGCDGGKQTVGQVNFHVCDCSNSCETLHEEVKNYFNLEEPKFSESLSTEDNQALRILNETCRKVKDRYEVELLWKNKDIELPESYETAYKRTLCLQKRFEKDPQLKNELQNQFDNLITKGYARKVTEDELRNSPTKVWYLPIFVIKNLNKPGKVRLVWDAAAKSNGVALNDFILTGPDMLKPLVEVLVTFREGQVAICGDIAEMFHQIKVKNTDIHCQRFLWWENNDLSSPPSIFVMSALTFGISCAPCIAHYVRNKNAEEFENQYPRAVDAIKNHHYMDDFIDCANSEDELYELASQVKLIHTSAGFHMRNWSSNSRKIFEKLNEQTSNEQQLLRLGSMEKVLGMHWDPNNDSLKFKCTFARLKRDILNNDLVPTKREVLQVLMSIFDPLGLLSPYTIGIKILLQDIWRSTIGWDDRLNENLHAKWCQWRTVLPHIPNINIQRCYSKLLKNADEIQLHTFVDAGEYAYAAVCYLRVQNGHQTTTNIVAAKSKVAPLKPLSIPRLELQAAIIGLRLAIQIQKYLRISISSRFWWTDSTTVLQWLRKDPRNLQQFVMHRVGEILETSNIVEWRWVPTSLNPADIGTKITSNKTVEMWYSGPKFLYDNSSEWPTRIDLGSTVTDELRHHVLLHETKNSNLLPLNFKYFSSWKKLYRALATFLLYLEKIRAKVRHETKGNTVTFELIQQSKIVLWRQAQLSEYEEEFRSLQCEGELSRSSKLISLNVFVDDNGLLKVKSRADLLNTYDAIILPHDHHVSFLVVRYCHIKYHHMTHETAINEIRAKFYIIRLRVLFKKVRRSCQYCKNMSAKPLPPQMAQLPRARLAVFERPFTYTGIDFFGPIHVAVGRRREKRWGVLFTCLTIRAVHIEVAHKLDTSSCIMSIRNFIARRGVPREIFTDNGTNFKASEKILCSEANNISFSDVCADNDSIKWRFNPPAAPHMGGAWERLVRSVKTVLQAICPEMSFNDESLFCALCEIESILNSRPLTFVSIEATDDQAITPNHLLLGSSNGHKPIIEHNVDLRQRWVRTQTFADKFWRRWIKEYSPLLTRRGKWFGKAPSIEIGDVVIVVDENLPRSTWPKGIVIDAIKAKDGQVRRVSVKTARGVLQRPAVKIAVLDVSGRMESAHHPN